MIQIWKQQYDEDTDITSVKLAYFDFENFSPTKFIDTAYPFNIDEIRKELLESKITKIGETPDIHKKIIWHDEDKQNIISFFHSLVDTITTNFLKLIINIDPLKVDIYTLKQGELLLLQQGLKKPEELPILSQEALAFGNDLDSLVKQWEEKSQKWLLAIGLSERIGASEKNKISLCHDEIQMYSIIDSLPKILNEAFSK